MASLAGSITGQKGRANSYTTTGGFYCGVITNTGESTKYYNYCLKFKTPTFTGKSTSLTFSISAMHNQPENSTVTLRYALCKSDANFSNYQTSGSVTDANQIKTGTCKFTVKSSYSNSSFTISTDALASNTTYYLIIYSRSGYTSQNSIYIRACTNHSVTLDYAATYTLTLKTTTGVASFTGGGTYDEGTTASTTATAADGYRLTKISGTTSDGSGTDSWTGCAGKTSYTTTWTMNADRTLTAYAEKISGVVYIDNGSSYDMYEIYIDNGTSWDQYEAYIDNGSSFELYGQ